MFAEKAIAYTTQIRRVALCMGCRQDQADDLVQETFLAAWRGRNTLRDAERFPEWLASIIRNKARDAFRKETRIATANRDYARQRLELEENIGAKEIDIFDELRASLQNIPTTERQLLRRYCMNIPARDIGEEFGLSAKQVRETVKRTLRFLRETRKTD